MRKFSGTVTACITPFTSCGIDREGLKSNLEEQIAAGIDGLLLLGTTGEAAAMSEGERRDVIRIAAGAIGGRVPLWVGTGCNSTGATIERTLEAEKLGADVALVVTPYYNCPTQQGIIEHIRALHDSTTLPICLYNVPKRTAISMDNKTIIALAELERVVAVKEASDSIEKLQGLIALNRCLKSPLSVFSGNDSLAMAAIALGAEGLISVATNLVPNYIVDFVREALRGEMERARERHYRLFKLFQALSIESNPIPIKAAMNICKKAAGPCRLPLTPLKEENLQRLKAELENWEWEIEGIAEIDRKKRAGQSAREEVIHG